jgi:hypothetical protein
MIIPELQSQLATNFYGRMNEMQMKIVEQRANV